MGSVLCALMQRKHESTLVPHPFVYKYRYYGVNNEPVSPPETDETSSSPPSSPSSASSSSSPVFRMKNFADDALFYRLCHTYYYGIGNTVTNLRDLCVKRKDEIAMAYRPVLRVESRQVELPAPQVVKQTAGASAADDQASLAQPPPPPRMATRIYTHYGERRNITYTELWQGIEGFGAGLRALIGLDTRQETSVRPAQVSSPPLSMPSAPMCGVDAPRIALFEETRWEWITSVFGLWTQGCVAVTVYANLGEDALLYALQEADVSAMVCNGQRVPQLVALMMSGKLAWIPLIYLDALPDAYVLPAGVMATCGDEAAAEAAKKRVCVRWTDVCAAGQAKLTHAREDVSTSAASEWAPQMPASNDALALIMYTSGTTGNPKGVLHTHGSIMAGVDTLNDKLIWIEPQLPKEDLTYCAFLPLAHIMEFACVNIFLHRGVLVCFSHPRTLTDEFALPHGDFAEYKPVILMAVPRIYDVLRKSVLSSLPAPGSLKRRLFDQAFVARHAALQRGFETPYYNAKIFAKVRAAFGGRLVLMLAGGSQLSEATRIFTNVCMGLVVQGYGLTETVASGATQMIGSLEGNNVGQLMKGCEVKLLDTEQFTHTDKPEPRGEILLRGPFLFKGYYKQPVLTKEAIDKDGWFHTGDVGAVAPADGVLRVIGRVKALAKNSLGEYIALERLESIYSNNPLTQPSGVCVVVHPARNYICALALTDAKSVERYLAAHPAVVQAIETELAGAEASARTYPGILACQAMRKAAADAFCATASEAKVPAFEVVRHVRLVDEEWTPENGLLTAALKLKRAVLEQHYKSVIDELFEEQ